MAKPIGNLFPTIPLRENPRHIMDCSNSSFLNGNIITIKYVITIPKHNPTKYTNPRISPINTDPNVKKHTNINGANRKNIYINVINVMSTIFYLQYLVLQYYYKNNSLYYVHRTFFTCHIKSHLNISLLYITRLVLVCILIVFIKLYLLHIRNHNYGYSKLFFLHY